LYQEKLSYFEIILATVFFLVFLGKMQCCLPLGILAFRLRPSQFSSNVQFGKNLGVQSGIAKKFFSALTEAHQFSLNSVVH